MLARLLRTIAHRRRAHAMLREEALRAQLDNRLAERRQRRAGRNARARAGAITRQHQVYLSDRLINSEAPVR